MIVALGEGTAVAQVPDLIDLSGQYMPPRRLVEPRGARAQVTSYDVTLNAPIPLAERSFLIPGATYHVESVSFADTPQGFADLRAFHGVDVPVLFVQLLPHDWSLSLRIAPGLAGDFHSVDADMFRFGAMALASHAFSDQLVLGGGAVASYAFGSFLPLPAGYLEWKPASPFVFEVFIPAFAHAKAVFGDRVELGYRVEVQGNEYAVRDERIAGAFPCVDGPPDPSRAELGAKADPDRCFDHLAYSVIAFGPTIAVRLFETVWLTAAAGHSALRRFEEKNPSGETIPDSVQNLPNTFFVRSGLTWRIPRGE